MSGACNFETGRLFKIEHQQEHLVEYNPKNGRKTKIRGFSPVSYIPELLMWDSSRILFGGVAAVSSLL